VSAVAITFTCTACLSEATVRAPWGAHHCLPKGWTARDCVPTFTLARRTDHIFACSTKCRRVLNERFPPPRVPKWFKYA
jgi:hypothetical protein